MWLWIAALLAVMVMLALSRAVLDLVGTLMVSRRTRSGLYLLVTMVSMLLSMMPSLLDSGIMDGMAADIDFLKSVADILAGRHWAPLSVCRRISFRDHGGLWSDVCVWSWPPWLSVIGMLCLRHDRLHAGAGAGRLVPPRGWGCWAGPGRLWMPWPRDC